MSKSEPTPNKPDGGSEIALIELARNQINYCWLSDRERRMSEVYKAAAL